MSHWAELDENNIVLRVLVGDNNDPAGDEGYQWLIDNLGGTWVQTSYNGNFRYNFAGVGFTYDPEADAFIAPQPYPSWLLNEQKKWVAPVDKPTDSWFWAWDEEAGTWVATKTV